MRYRMSVIYGHPVIAATRALRFSDHVTKRNGGSGDENDTRQQGMRSAQVHDSLTHKYFVFSDVILPRNQRGVLVCNIGRF